MGHARSVLLIPFVLGVKSMFHVVRTVSVHKDQIPKTTASANQDIIPPNLAKFVTYVPAIHIVQVTLIFSDAHTTPAQTLNHTKYRTVNVTKALGARAYYHRIKLMELMKLEIVQSTTQRPVLNVELMTFASMTQSNTVH